LMVLQKVENVCRSEQSEESWPGRICMATLKISPVGRNDKMTKWQNGNRG